ncbi:hypothetical protein Tco_1007282, partial [Tanacetum coccineum]
MDLKDTEYFNELLQLNNAYRISRFGCTDTKKWQRTVDNKTTLDISIYSEGETEIYKLSDLAFFKSSRKLQSIEVDAFYFVRARNDAILVTRIN